MATGYLLTKKCTNSVTRWLGGHQVQVGVVEVRYVPCHGCACADFANIRHKLIRRFQRPIQVGVVQEFGFDCELCFGDFRVNLDVAVFSYPLQGDVFAVFRRAEPSK